jgi:hypothetical protein
VLELALHVLCNEMGTVHLCSQQLSVQPPAVLPCCCLWGLEDVGSNAGLVQGTVTHSMNCRRTVSGSAAPILQLMLQRNPVVYVCEAESGQIILESYKAVALQPLCASLQPGQSAPNNRARKRTLYVP